MQKKYHITIRIIHWLMALIILSLFGVGIFMAGLDNSVTYKFTLYDLHKSFGVLVILFFALRLIARLTTKVPELPKGIKKMDKIMAKAAHIILYALMFLVPLSGVAMSQTLGYPVKVFGFELPKIFATNKELGEIIRDSHEIIAYAIVGVVSLHVAGVIKHKFFDKKENDVLPRML